MPRLKIVGGIYGEKCARPLWNQVYGSGGRAAAALATFSNEIELFGYVGQGRRESAELSFRSLGISTHLTDIPENVSFDYLHPLSRPAQSPHFNVEDMHDPISVEGDVVLRFGMVEGDAKVTADVAIFDPQTGDVPQPFSSNGSTAKRLAVVLNENEALRIGGSTALEAAQIIQREWDAQTVVVKLGTRGALVLEGSNNPVEVPPFQSSRVFKIGSGDIFSAVFAYCWGSEGRPAAESAKIASHAVADYVESRSLPLRALPVDVSRDVVMAKERGQIYLAGPFFDVSQRWMINESLMILETLGAPVFSPIHDVGPATGRSDTAAFDLKGLDESSVVLAFVDSRDPGTLLEVGYALKAEKNVVVLCERLPDHEQTMFLVPNCHIAHDFSTALYKAVWLS